MKMILQLFRQPLKSLSGLLLMTIAASILCVCVGQAIAAQATKEDLDHRFTTVAIPSPQEDLQGADRIRVEQDLIAWLEQMAQEHPDIVRGASPNGVLSAFIPELLPYNFMRESNELVLSNAITPGGYARSSYKPYVASEPYTGAVLVITLEQVSQVATPLEGYLRNQEKNTLRPGLPPDKYERWMFYQQYLSDAYWRTVPTGYSVELVGTVIQTVSLQDGLRDPEGMTVRLTLTMPTPQQIQELDLQPGAQYLVYGTDYYDGYRFLEAYLNFAGYGHVQLNPYDHSLLEEPTEAEFKRFKDQGFGDVVIKYNDVPLRQWEYEMLNCVYMSMCMPINLVEYDQILGENGNLVDLTAKTEVSYLDSNGNSHTISAEEYNNRYAVPTITCLDVELAQFLESAEGSIWKWAIENNEVNAHAFSVIGVEELDQLSSFAVGDTKMADGREFTKEEVETGAQVCLIHEWVASLAGLQIGDTITLNVYDSDCGLPYQTGRGEGNALLQSVASFHFSTTPFTETAEYTIVGLWRGTAKPNVDTNPYAISANSVIVPVSSVQTPMEHTNSIALVSAALENGMIAQFNELVKQGGYAGRFKYFEQGYSEIATNFHNYLELARQILSVGLVLYLILLSLFLLLYPGAQRSVTNMMQSIGAGYLRRFGYVLSSSMSIVLPASLLGGLLGMRLWDTIVALIQATAESNVALQFSPDTLIKVAMVQLGLVLMLNALVAIFVAAPKSMSSRR